MTDYENNSNNAEAPGGTPQGNCNRQEYQAPPQTYYAPQSGAQAARQPFEEKASVGFAILSFFIPIAGLIIFLSKKNSRPKTAKASGICALVSFILQIILTVVICTTFGAFATRVAENPEQLDSYIQQAIGDNSKNLVDGNEIGDFVCDVTDISKTSDKAGNAAIIVTYSFTNNSDKEIDFDSAFYIAPMQNGETLVRTFTGTDEDNTLWDSTATQPGETSRIERIYSLSDETSDLKIDIYDNTDPDNANYIEYQLSLEN